MFANLMNIYIYRNNLEILRIFMIKEAENKRAWLPCTPILYAVFSKSVVGAADGAA